MPSARFYSFHVYFFELRYWLKKRNKGLLLNSGMHNI